MDSPDWLGEIDVPIRNPYLSLINKCNEKDFETILGVILHFNEHGGLNSNEEKILSELNQFSMKQFPYIYLHALKNKVPFESLTKLMTWTEFEEVTGIIFEEAGWASINNFRYFGEGVASRERKRFEIDVIAFKKPYVLLIDNKRHAKMSPSITNTWVEKQQNRAYELYEQLPIIHDTPNFSWLKNWKNAFLIPMILTWRDVSITITNQTPIVSSSTLIDLLANFSSYMVDSDWFKLKWESI